VALCLGPYNYAVNEVLTTVIPAGTLSITDALRVFSIRSMAPPD
jgi:hypothetical protein